MVMRGDLDLPGLQLLHRMIPAMMPELQLERFPAQRYPRELMPQANSEDRLPPHEPSNRIDRIRAGLGIAGAVGKKYAVRFQSQHIFRWSLRRNDGHFASLAAQLAQNVLLDAEIVGDDVESRRLIFHANHSHRFVRAFADFPYVGALRADLFCQIRSVHLRDRPRLRDQLLGVALNLQKNTPHHAVITEMPHKRARVDIRQHRHFELFQIFLCNLLRAPVRTDARELAHNQALDPRTRGLVVFLVRAVISDFWIRQNDDLSGVGRVGENFLISGDGSIKNDFAVAFAFGAVAFASEDSAVFQRKDSLHSRSEEWILWILTGITAWAKRRTTRN